MIFKNFIFLKIYKNSTQNDYEAKILINKGACADVYEGVHLATNEKIIIKVILTSSILFLLIQKYIH